MDIKELDKLAYEGKEMPSTLASYEQAYYQAARYLYICFFNNQLNLQQCRAEKEKLVRVYYEGKKQWEFFLSLNVIGAKLEKLKQQGFNSSLEWEVLEDINNIFK